MPLHRRWCGSTLAVAAFLLAGASTAGAVIPAEEPTTFPIARDRWPALERAAQGCVEDRADVWGDVEVKVTFRPARTPLVKLAPSAFAQGGGRLHPKRGRHVRARGRF